MYLFIEIVLQTLLSFFAIMFITRILGRQQVAQLTLYEYINGITVGSIAANLATDVSQRTWQHLMGLMIYGALTFLVASFVMKNRTASKIIQGEPVMVIQEGKILEKNLHRYHYTIDDLNVLLRRKNIFDIRDVKYAILEATGEISVMRKAEKQPVTHEDLIIQPAMIKELELEVVVTGTIIYENLRSRGLTAQWLINRLREESITSIKDVFYAVLSPENILFIDLYDDYLEKRKGISESDDIPGYKD